MTLTPALQSHYHFPLQACRGDRLDAGISMVPPMTVTVADQAFGGDRFDSSTILSPTTERNSQLAATLKIPCDHDFIIGYSTVFGRSLFTILLKKLPNLMFVFQFFKQDSNHGATRSTALGSFSLSATCSLNVDAKTISSH